MGRAEVTTRPTESVAAAGAPPVTITADRVIVATGADVSPKRPLALSAVAVHSLLPDDLARPEWSALLRYTDKPIVIVGSGKTAMDAIIFLSRHHPSALSRVRCISGRGTWFFNRTTCSPFDERGQPMPDAPNMLDCMLDTLEAYDGTNGEEVLRLMAKKNWFHSAVPEPGTFMLGMCSEEEMGIVREALGPAGERVVRAHLLDVVQKSAGELAMSLRSVDGARCFETSLEAGSFVVNCTDHIGGKPWAPIVSEDGLVLSTQSALGFTGPTAHLLTHAWYKGVLKDTWRHFPRFELTEKKCDWALRTMFVLAVINSRFIDEVLPEMRQSAKGLSLAAANLQAQIPRIKKSMPQIYRKMMAAIPGRYDDEPQGPVGQPHAHVQSKL